MGPTAAELRDGEVVATWASWTVYWEAKRVSIRMIRKMERVRQQPEPVVGRLMGLLDATAASVLPSDNVCTRKDETHMCDGSEQGRTGGTGTVEEDKLGEMVTCELALWI